MKRLFFIGIALSAVFSASAQDSLEVGFDAALRSLKAALHIKSLRRELEQLKESVIAKTEAPDRFRALLQEIGTNHAMVDYIMRPADAVTFSDQYNPVITNKKELFLYEYMGSYAAYRSFIKEGSFFRRYSGSVNGVQPYTKSVVAALHEQGKHTARNTVMFEVEGGNCYYLSQKIAATQTTIQGAEWHVAMHNQGGHHILSITAYDPAHAPLIFIIDTHNGGTYSVTGDYVAIDAHFDLQNLGLVMEPSMVSDYNCYLYTFGLTKAAMQYLQNHDLADLKQACESADYKRATKILHCGMQQYLSYYQLSNGQYVRKSRVEIDTYNRNLRWQLSGEILLSELKKLAQQKKA